MPTGDVTKAARALRADSQRVCDDRKAGAVERQPRLLPGVRACSLFRNIQIDDAEHKVLAFGDYGEYWKEPGNALLTQRPSVVSYDTSQSDSLYMCADSMFLYTISKSEQARADSLAKVKAKAADSLAGSKGGSSVDSLAAKPSAADPKASQDGSQADAAAPQAAAGAVETSSKLRMPVLVPLQNP